MSLACECFHHWAKRTCGHDADVEVKRHGRRMFVCGDCTSTADTADRPIAEVPPFNLTRTTSNAKWHPPRPRA